jgi:hypothetical protein
MLPKESESRTEAFDLIKKVLMACGELSVEDKRRLEQLGRLFDQAALDVQPPIVPTLRAS